MSAPSQPDTQLTLFASEVAKAAHAAASAGVAKAFTEQRHASAPTTPLSSYPILMRVDQVANFLNVTGKHVRELTELGCLERSDFSKPGATRACLRIKRDSVAKFLESRTQTN